MSYLVLARKYRPRAFNELVGQPHVVQALVNALTQQRLHHAYLFAGTRGVGKTTISRILAKSLNCTGADGSGGITAQPCGVCQACREIDSGRYLDYVELDAASNRGVDEITQLLDQAVYKPAIGRFKVYMIDEVHMLTHHAFNAMLKTLEEPPEYLKFVLATTDPQKVPPTVLSRCLQFNLRPMAPPTVRAQLELILTQEGIVAAPAALQLIARAARGSMRDALSLADQAIAHGGGAVEEAGVRQMLGAVDRSHAARLIAALADRDGVAVIAAIDELRALGLSAVGALDEMAALLQEMAVQQAVPEAADVDEPDATERTRLAALLAPDETQLLYSIVLRGRAEIGLAPDEYSGLVMVVLRMLAFAPQGQMATQGQAVARVTRAESSAIATSPPTGEASAGPAATAAPIVPKVGVAPPPPLATRPPPAAPSPPATSAPATASSPPTTSAPAERLLPTATPSPSATSSASNMLAPELGDRWAEAVQALDASGRIAALVRELAMQAQCIAIDDNSVPPRWRLRVERETLRAPAHCEKLQIALSEWLGHAVRLDIEAGAADDTPARREAAERARRQSEAEATLRNDPLVQALMAQYKTARIVPGSVKSL